MINKITILIFTFFGLGFSYSQCLDNTNKKGYFDESSISNRWWKSGVGTFSLETNDFYHREGSEGGSLKVIVPENQNNQPNGVRIVTTIGQCGGYNFSSGNKWNVSLYIKGDLGDVIDFSFRNGASGGLISDIVSHTIMYKGWHYIRLDITPSGNTNEGRLRLDFKNTGTYWIDNIILASGSEGNEWNEWIVAESGGDFNSITAATKNNNNYKPGDIILLKTGTYRNSNWDGDDEFNEAGNNWVLEQITIMELTRQ